ncbi:hypothetical protein [Crocosphaera sp. XPORK-15E]|uniref:arginine synthesis PII-interacting regulator PirA n=1 Tax=Crocosphaera sp. XPORK-15E TaxID=3110247 RepID=UPI002B1FBDFF|nr:hypothetical protein [Crocosphaera sp. XPORK-15E]MEA5533781.1 hypothetical protein [Crocosphaera sp. XPORK-15E]
MTYKQQHLTEADQIHRANMLKSLEHRLEVARSKGNQSLIQQLEAEKAYYYR